MCTSIRVREKERESGRVNDIKRRCIDTERRREREREGRER